MTRGTPAAERGFTDLLAPAVVLLFPWADFAVTSGQRFAAPMLALGLVVAAMGLGIGCYLTKLRLLGRRIVMTCVLVLAASFFYYSVPVEVRMRTFALLCLICTVVLVVLLGERLSPVISAAFGAMILATLVLPGLPEFSIKGTGVEARPSNAAPVLHLVLDGFGGPRTLAPSWEGMERKWVESGFRVFRQVRVKEPTTIESLSLVLGAAGRPVAAERLASATYRFGDSPYLAELSNDRLLSVQQPDYLDVCRDGVADRCETYPYVRPFGVATAAPGLVAGATLATSVFVRRSMFLGVLLGTAGPRVQPMMGRSAQLPAWIWAERWVDPRPVLAAARRMISELPAETTGHAFYAHWLLPHSPYALGADCVPRPLADWSGREGAIGSVDVAYQEQAGCASTLALEFAQAVASRSSTPAWVFVHGDHGPRFSLEGDAPDALDQRARTAFVAVKGPGVIPGGDETPAYLPDLLFEMRRQAFGRTSR